MIYRCAFAICLLIAVSGLSCGAGGTGGAAPKKAPGGSPAKAPAGRKPPEPQTAKPAASSDLDRALQDLNRLLEKIDAATRTPAPRVAP